MSNFDNKRVGGKNMSKFSMRLMQLRWSLDMTRKEFAESLGMNQSTYTSYETIRKHPSVELMQKLVLVYNIDLNEWILEI